MEKEPMRCMDALEERVYGGIVSAVRESTLDAAARRRLLDAAMGALVEAQDGLRAAGADTCRCEEAVAAAQRRLDAVERALADEPGAMP